MADSKRVDDLATLNVLDEDTILKQLEVRYKKDLIYTYIGDILLAVNPYREITIYTDELSSKYVNLKYRRSMRPHIFAIADNAYHQMKQTGVNQCCVISGESGAGKTESAKFIVQQIVRHSETHQRGIQEKILQVNPLLEAFGNAQTVMNNNSSRFGKFIELQFTVDGKVLGASITEYLLEKSRVIFQGAGERNFHMFYYMFAGLNDKKLRKYYLSTPEKHRILNGGRSQHSIYTSDEDFRHCQQKYNELKSLLITVGFTVEDALTMWVLLAAILHLGDLEFEFDYDLDGAYVSDERKLQVVSTLLKVDPVELAAALISTTHITRGEEITVLKNVEQANDGRDALVKALYGRLFSWIVNQINDMLAPREGYRGETRCNIGILDIFGFENFKHNSFEQLCINVTNEQLQYYFNQSIFAWEQSEYANEGINMQEIQFQNNMKLLELFMARPIGILSLLDEESKFPQATDDTLVQKLNERCSRNSYYIAASGVYRGAIFGIRHYASQVVYNAAGFLEKNRDTLHQNIVDAMSDSDNSFIREIFSTNFKGSSAQHNVSSKDRKAILLCAKQPKLRPGGNEKQRTMSRKKTDPKQPMTVASYFKESLTDLMDKILSAEPQFIRCIKPNHTKQPNRFDREVVLNQLRCTGVLETTRIRRLGYAVRLPFADFLRSYKFLHFPLSANIAPNAVNCYQLIQSTGLTEWQVGKSKVFLKYWHTEQLDSMMEALRQHVVTVQRCVRGFVAIKRRQHRKHIAKVQKRQSKGLASYIKDNGNEFWESLSRTNEHDKRRGNEALEAANLLHAQRMNLLQEQRRERNLPELSTGEERPPTMVHQEDNNNDTFNPGASRKTILDDTVSVLSRLNAGVWSRVYFGEKHRVLDAFSVASENLVVDGSVKQQRGRIGFGSINNPRRDTETTRIRSFIGKGVRFEMDSDGHIWALRLTKNHVYVNGWRQPQSHCVTAEVIKRGGRLPYGEPIKVFDMDEFKIRLAMEQQTEPDLMSIQNFCVLFLSFIKTDEVIEKTPCWIALTVLPALNRKLSDPEVLEEIEEIRAEYRTAKEIQEEALRITKKRQWAKLNLRSSNFEKEKKKEGRKANLEARQKAISEGLPWRFSWEKEEESGSDASDEQSESNSSAMESTLYASESSEQELRPSNIRRAAMNKLSEKNPGLVTRRNSQFARLLLNETKEVYYTSDHSGQKIEKKRQWAKVSELRKRQDETDFSK